MYQAIDSKVGHLGIGLKWGNNKFHACSLQCLQHISRSASVLQEVRQHIAIKALVLCCMVAMKCAYRKGMLVVGPA